MPFGPLKRSEEVESIVMKGNGRKYYRVRKDRFYGGILTLDAVGCNLLCAYCWNYGRNVNPGSALGFYLSPEEVAQKFKKMLRETRIRRVRISGAEPLLGEASFLHFMKIVDLLSADSKDLEFILETNGVILAKYPDFSKLISRFGNIFVRVSIKGFDEESFERITGAKGEFFWLQIEALKNLIDYKVVSWPAVMVEMFDKRSLRILEATLKKAGFKGQLEFEYLYRYPFVMENLKRRGIVDIAL